MLFGNPYKFAILIDEIDELTNRTFVEGICFIFVNGNIFPKTLPAISTSLTQVFFAVRDLFLKIDNLENAQLFAKNKNELYAFLMKTVHHQNDMNEEEAHSYWKYCFYDYIDSNDEEDDIWYISNQNQEKLLYKYHQKTHDLLLDKGYVKSVLANFIQYYQRKYLVDKQFEILHLSDV